MKRIKFKLLAIVALTLVVLIGLTAMYGCSSDDDSLQPTQGAAQNLQERFADLFDNLDDNEAAEAAVPVAAVRTMPPPQPTTAVSVEGENDTSLIYNENDDINNDIVEDDTADILPPVEIIDEDEPYAYESYVEEEYEAEVIPQELFAITPTGRRFHLEHCHHARNASQLLTREAAEARGLTPCGTCRP